MPAQPTTTITTTDMCNLFHKAAKLGKHSKLNTRELDTKHTDLVQSNVFKIRQKSADEGKRFADLLQQNPTQACLLHFHIPDMCFKCLF